jgi:hypothetical protein
MVPLACHVNQGTSQPPAKKERQAEACRPRYCCLSAAGIYGTAVPV